MSRRVQCSRSMGTGGGGWSLLTRLQAFSMVFIVGSSKIHF
ncbi:MAG: hypothetical protein QXJ19_04575 [Candidatus Bathyarchaeia archaeon]